MDCWLEAGKEGKMVAMEWFIRDFDEYTNALEALGFTQVLGETDTKLQEYGKLMVR